MEMINICILRPCGRRLKNIILFEQTQDFNLTEWFEDFNKENKLSPPFVVESFAYCTGGGWSKIDFIDQPDEDSLISYPKIKQEFVCKLWMLMLKWHCAAMRYAVSWWRIPNEELGSQKQP